MGVRTSILLSVVVALLICVPLAWAGGFCNQPLGPCGADLSPQGGDGQINVNDLLAVINSWGESNPGCPRPVGDCAPLPNGDCAVNVNDLLAVINTWGSCTTPTGACCVNSECLQLTQASCLNAFGTYFGNNSPCNIVCESFSNDECAGAIIVSNGNHAITNKGTTTSLGPPQMECIVGGSANLTRDVWYLYNATCTGTVTVATCATTSSVTNTVLAAYTGNCFNLVQVACDDDGCLAINGSRLSRMTFSAAQGTTYRIRVGSWGNDFCNQGVMTLSISCVSGETDK